MSSGRVLAFDFGLNHIGVAVGTESLCSAQALTAIKAQNGIPNEQQMEAVFKEWQPDYLVVGMPLNMDGSNEVMTNRAKKFGRRLMTKYGIRVYFKDERLSSVEAKDEIFNYHGGYRTLVKNKGKIDATAAKIILESFFEAGGSAAGFDYSDPVGKKQD